MGKDQKNKQINEVCDNKSRSADIFAWGSDK